MIGAFYILLSVVIFYYFIKLVSNKLYIVQVGILLGILCLFGCGILLNQIYDYSIFDVNFLLMFNLLFIYMLFYNFYSLLKYSVNDKSVIINTEKIENSFMWFHNTENKLIFPNQIVSLDDNDDKLKLLTFLEKDTKLIRDNNSHYFFKCVIIDNKFNILRVFKKIIIDQKTNKILGVVGIAENLTELYDMNLQKEIQFSIKNSNYDHARSLIHQKINPRICWSF